MNKLVITTLASWLLLFTGSFAGIQTDRSGIAVASFLVGLAVSPSPLIPSLDAHLPSAEQPTPQGNPSTKVWVNTKSHVYHCPGTRYYGNTKNGEYMTQADAQSKGNRPAYGKVCR